MLDRAPTEEEIAKAYNADLCSCCGKQIEIKNGALTEAMYTPWHSHYSCYERICGPYKSTEQIISELDAKFARLERLVATLKRKLE